MAHLERFPLLISSFILIFQFQSTKITKKGCIFFIRRYFLFFISPSLQKTQYHPLMLRGCVEIKKSNKHFTGKNCFMDLCREIKYDALFESWWYRGKNICQIGLNFTSIWVIWASTKVHKIIFTSEALGTFIWYHHHRF